MKSRPERNKSSRKAAKTAKTRGYGFNGFQALSIPEEDFQLDFRKNPDVLGTMVDAMGDGVFTVNAQGHIVAWSAGAARITGYSSDDVIGKSCHILEGKNCKGFYKLTEFLENHYTLSVGNLQSGM